MNSIKLYYKMDTIFMNSENSETSDPHSLLLNLSDKTNLKRSERNVALANLNIYYTQKIRSKTGYYLELLTPEMMKLLGSTKNKITKDENGENVPHLEITEVTLVHCNIVNSDYQHDLSVLFKVVANKFFGQLLDISPKNIYLRTFISGFSYIEEWFTDQNSKPLQREDKKTLLQLLINV